MDYLIKESDGMNLSFWEYDKILNGTDFTIVGAGIVGTCTALFLRDKFPAAKIVILERSMLPKGASTKNAGFACFGSVSEILDDLEHMSRAQVMELIKLRVDGLQLLQQLVPKETMDLQNHGGYEVFENHLFPKYEENIPRLNAMISEACNLENCFETQDNTFGFRFGKQVIFNQYEAQLHPVKMMESLHNQCQQKSIKILFGAHIESIEEQTDHVQIKLEQGRYSSQKIVYCTNAFSQNFFPKEDVLPARNQVLVTKVIPNLPICGTFHYDKGYVYFRNYENRMLIGGARNLDPEGETTQAFGPNEDIIGHLKHLLENHILPNHTIAYDYQWSGIIAVGKSKEPIVRQFSPNSYGAFRLGGMGVAIGSKIAQKLSDLIVYNT